MNNASWFSKIGSRILLSSLVPLLIMSVLLTSLMIKTRHDDTEAHLQQLTENSLNYLAAHAEFGLYSGDVMALEEISNKTLKQQQIIGVAFIDPDQALLYEIGTNPPFNFAQLKQQRTSVNVAGSTTFSVYEPVWLHTSNVTDFEETDTEEKNLIDNKNPTLLGWVWLSVSRAETIQKQNDILFVTLSSVSVLLLLSIWIAYRLGRNITNPVLALSGVIQGFENNEIKPIAQERGPEELKLLSRGVNELATKVSQSNQQLKQEVDNATEMLRETLADLEIRNSDLLQTQSRLEEAISAKDSFLARMSHELRTPLTSVIGFSKLLNHSNDLNTRKDYTQNILHSSTLLLSIIDDILDFSKMQNSNIELDKSAFDLRLCLEDLVAMHAYNAHEKSVEIVLLIDTDIPDWVHADEMRLGQVINNLLGNAIKFTKEGEVVLRVSNISDKQEHLLLQFSVKDSGIGIEPENLIHLFKPFTQADTSIRRRFGGSGLGLVICKQLVELMHGEISVSSELNKGTEFTFTLPFHNAPEFNNQPAPINNNKIAIYDSHPWARRALRNQISRWSNNVFALKSKQHLLNNIQHQNDETQLVILGLSPTDTEDKVVYPLLADIRSHYTGPILILSGLSITQESLSRSCQEQFSPLFMLPKPTREKTLIQNINQIEQEFFPSIRDKALTSTEVIRSANYSEELPFRDLSILVAEDTSFNLKLVTELLNQHGANIKGVSNGAEAVKAFQAQSFDIIIMDIHMPELDGIEATRKIIELQNSRAKKTPIIGLTANVIGNEEQEMQDAGAVAILYKPLDEQAIYQTVARYCHRQQPKIQQSSGTTARINELKQELKKLSLLLKQNHRDNNYAGVRSTLHQLSGLAGLYGIANIQGLVQLLQNNSHDVTGVDFLEKMNALEHSINQL